MKHLAFLASIFVSRNGIASRNFGSSKGPGVKASAFLIVAVIITLSSALAPNARMGRVRASDGSDNGEIESARTKSPIRPFIFTATAENDLGVDFATIDDPALNGNPNAIIEVTQNWNPGDQGGIYNDHHIGVFFTAGHWAVFNQDHAKIPVGASFNVAVVNGFVVTAGASNLTDGRLEIDNPATNGKPNILLQVTSNWSSTAQVYNDHAFSVSFRNNQWGIANVDGAPIASGALFNVWVAPFGFVQPATTANCVANSTQLNDPSVNGNFNPIILATPDFGGSEFGIINNHPTGVFASSASKGAPPNWSIFNEDFASMTLGTAFSVIAFNPPVIQNVTFPARRCSLPGSISIPGSTVLINGVTAATAQDPANPTTSLICKKGGKIIQPGDTVTLQILDGDLVLSSELEFQRPSSE